MTKKHNKQIFHAKQCVVKPGLSADDVKGLKKMVMKRVREKFEGNRNGNVTLVQVQHNINYYEAASNLPLLNTTYAKEYVVTKNTDAFLHEIVSMFKNNPEMKDGLIGSLLN
eukprot:861509-Ditylum_brightwellii.AAC.1